MLLSDRPASPRPRRLLSLDGGGIRGVLAAEILVEIEETLKRRDPKITCLGDYFDFVGGTSTGSILAAGVAMGLSAAALRDFYLERGPHLFKKTFFARLWHKYDSAPLVRELKNVFGDRALGSPDFRTLLLVVSKNITTGETWFFSNNPKGKYRASDASRKVADLILASSAAPTYFAPVPLEIAPASGGGKPVVHEFVDGGMSMFNNPSLQLFLEATDPQYGLGWPRGEKNVLLVSVGTGFAAPTLPAGSAAGTTLIGWAGHAIDTLMEDANVQQNLLLRMISRSRGGARIDQELGSHGAPSADALAPPDGSARLALLTYHRYTTSLTSDRLHGSLGLPKTIDAEALRGLDAGDQVRELAAVGRAVAKEQVSEGDFEGFWN